MKKLNRISKALLAIAMMLVVVFPSLAHDFEVDGIYYNYLDETAKTVEVTYKGDYFVSYSNEYTGGVTIPHRFYTMALLIQLPQLAHMRSMVAPA